MKRLNDVSKIYTNGIIYIVDVAEMLPPGFTGLVQDSIVLGKSIFIPAMREFRNASATDFSIEKAVWTIPNESTLYNVGVFAKETKYNVVAASS